MGIQKLISSCLATGTSHSEKGKKVAIIPEEDEVILTFKTDHDDVREFLDIDKACDVTFFYMKHRQRPILFFVELKGKDIKGAAAQIKSTLTATTKVVSAMFKQGYPNAKDMRAIVVRDGSTPRDLTEIQEKFFKETGVKLLIAREEANLRKYIVL